MSTTSSRTIQVQFSGDITSEIIQSALDNDTSPAQIDIISLAIGDNIVTAPVISGIVVTGLLIIPPAGNINLITLKGVSADVGIPIHLTDPFSMSLDTTFVSLDLFAAAAIVGVRLIWT